jgi:hypothetical protein
VLVLPSKVESFGTVAMEAMVRQRLVLVSEACGITEWASLRQGLTVISSDCGLSQELQNCRKLSEFELFGRCHIARKVVFEHVQWNRELWLSSFNACLPKPADYVLKTERLATRLLRTVRG